MCRIRRLTACEYKSSRTNRYAVLCTSSLELRSFVPAPIRSEALCAFWACHFERETAKDSPPTRIMCQWGISNCAMLYIHSERTSTARSELRTCSVAVFQAIWRVCRCEGHVEGPTQYRPPVNCVSLSMLSLRNISRFEEHRCVPGYSGRSGEEQY